MSSIRSFNVESLRDAQKSLTRARICDAAREVFNEYGYAVVTLEQIAQAAGTRRSTVYNHFRNKDDILGAIAEDYGAGLIALVAELPGPRPSRAEIDRWIKQVVDYTVTEKVPTVLLMRLGDQIAVPQPLEMLGKKLIRAMADRLPAFRRAVEPGPHQGLALARAIAAVHQLGWACLHQIRHGTQNDNTGLAADMLTVAAEFFERLVCEDASTQVTDQLSRGASSLKPIVSKSQE